MEVGWKCVVVTVNVQIKETINLQYNLHGIYTRMGKVTATIKVKLCQKMSKIQQSPLFQVYLDFCKAYNELIGMYL